MTMTLKDKFKCGNCREEADQVIAFGRRQPQYAWDDSFFDLQLCLTCLREATAMLEKQQAKPDDT